MYDVYTLSHLYHLSSSAEVKILRSSRGDPVLVTSLSCLCLNSRMIILVLLHMVKRYNSSCSRLHQVPTPHQNAFVYCPLGVLFDAASRHLHRTTCTTAASTRGSITNGSQHNVAIHSTCSKHMNSHSNYSSIFTPSSCLSPPLAFPSALFF
jgi:hypothetical protein